MEMILHLKDEIFDLVKYGSKNIKIRLYVKLIIEILSTFFFCNKINIDRGSDHMITIYASFAVMLIYLIVKGKKALHMLQQNLYNENNRYLKWIKGNLETAFFNLDFISTILIIVGAILNNKTSDILIISALVIYFIDAIRIINKRKTEQVKKPLVITARVKRLIVMISILYLIPVVCIFFFEDLKYLLLMVLSVLVFFEFIVVLIAKFFNRPVERLVYLKFYHQAQRKLKSMTNLNVVGITGSYGKTSSKNILSDILNIKYVTRPTPKNLNTEYGLMITINNHLDKYDQVFIAEMGAYVRGEIKTLCDMVHPKYGILTKVGTAHLESFKSRENIQKTKFELIESLPSDGCGVLNRDDEWQVSYNLKNNVKILWIGVDTKDEVDVRATNIKCNNNGSTFDVIFKGDKKKYPFETKLLGKNNVYNILASIALGKELGMSITELQAGVRKVRPVEHRLELKNLGGMYMIDDAYNSNPVGAEMAVDVLGMMPGVKVVVTPGMIELGDKQEEYNFEFGKQIAKKADYVILIGEKITKPIYNGLIDAGFKKDNIHILNDVVDSYPLVRKLAGKKEVYALYENDLPDSYNEK